MGTNYYGTQVKKLEVVDKQEQVIVDELRSMSKNTSIELDNVVSDYFQIQRDKLGRIHIGKQSAGWVFSFNHNDWIHFTDRASLMEWLDTVEIESEYGEVKTTAEFMKMVDSRTNGEYAIEYKRRNPNYNIDKDGLEFSTSTNFC